MRQIFFVHIPRTMGTTLKNIFLAPHFQAGEYHLDVKWGNLFNNPSLKIHKFIAGHLPLNARQFMFSPRCITILRDPIQRAYSMYHFIKKNPNHYLYRAANEMNLVDFAYNSATGFCLSNLQCKYITYSKPIVRGTAIDLTKALSSSRTDGDYAIELVDRSFEWVCIADRFEQSVKLLWEILGLKGVEVTPGLKAHRHRIAKREREILTEINREDLILYKYVLKHYMEDY